MSELLLSQVPLFQGLPPEELRRLAAALRLVSVPADCLLFKEGEYGDRFYIVAAGEIEIIKALDTSTPRLLGVRGRGEYIGEMSLLNRDGRRTASVRTRTPAELLEMTRADFDALLARQPSLAYAMVRVLSERLHQAHTTALRDLQAKNEELVNAYGALQHALAQLVEKEKLEHELHLAREVQASLLPRHTPPLAGWDFAAAWQPAREVSGDFYDFIPLAFGAFGPAPSNRWGLTIADVAGKGMPAALFMAVARSLVRGAVDSPRQPAEALTHANRLIYADAGQGLFVTLFYAQLNPATGDLIYVNAGHAPPRLYRAATREWRELTRTGLALGLTGGAVLQQAALQLHPGDCLVLYTDGLTDAVNPQGDRLDEAQLWNALQASRGASAGEIAARLEAVVAEFRAGHPLYDDITLVVVKRL